jgi:hypothetical protein
MSRSRGGLGRSVVLGLVLVALIAGVGWVVHERFVAPPPEPPPSARVTPPAVPVPVVPAVEPAEPALTVVSVLDVEGSVERGQGEAWSPLRVGDRLAGSDSIRAHAGGRAELRVGDEDSQLTVLEGSEVRVEEVTRAVHAFRLKRGRLKVDYQPRGERLLRVESEGGAVAETRGARFTVLRSGIAVAVVAEEGAVNLTAAGNSVRVGAGEQSVARDGEGPSVPVSIPREVLLRVARRDGRGATCATLKGQVRPGTEVFVDGASAAVNREGHFQVRVSSPKGREGVRVEAREPSGRVKEKLIACLPPRGKPRAGEDEATVRFDWDHAP